jgi:hypothetical protein
MLLALCITPANDVWLRDWIIAAVIGLEKREALGQLDTDSKNELSSYRNTLHENAINLRAGQNVLQKWTGSWETRDFFDSLKEERIISVRTRWKDLKGLEYDRIEDYRLIVNNAYGGESFTIVQLAMPRR